MSFSQLPPGEELRRYIRVLTLSSNVPTPNEGPDEVEGVPYCTSVTPPVSRSRPLSPPPGDDGIFTEHVERTESLRFARMCRTFFIFNMRCVRGKQRESPNIFLTDFLSATFSILCIWFILSWMKRSFHRRSRLLQRAGGRQKTLKTSYDTKLFAFSSVFIEHTQAWTLTQQINPKI